MHGDGGKVSRWVRLVGTLFVDLWLEDQTNLEKYRPGSMELQSDTGSATLQIMI